MISYINLKPQFKYITKWKEYLLLQSFDKNQLISTNPFAIDQEFFPSFEKKIIESVPSSDSIDRIYDMKNYKNYFIACILSGGMTFVGIWEQFSLKLLWGCKGRCIQGIRITSQYLIIITSMGNYVIRVEWSTLASSSSEKIPIYYYPREIDNLVLASNDESGLHWEDYPLYNEFPVDLYTFPKNEYITDVNWLEQVGYIFGGSGSIFQMDSNFVIQKHINTSFSFSRETLYYENSICIIINYNIAIVFNLQKGAILGQWELYKKAIKGVFLKNGILVTSGRDDFSIKFTDVLTGKCLYCHQISPTDLPIQGVIHGLYWEGRKLYGLMNDYLLQWELPPEVAQLKGSIM